MAEASGGEPTSPSELFRSLESLGLERLPSLEAALGYGLAAQHAQSDPTTGIIDAVQLFVGATREDPQVSRAVLSVMNLEDFYSAVGPRARARCDHQTDGA